MDELSKKNAVKNFYEEYIRLDERQKEDFAKVVDKLLDENFIYGQINEDKNDYYTIYNLRDIIEYYFSLIDYSLVHDDVNKIVYLASENDRNRIHLKKLETVLLVLLRKFYYLKGREDITSSTNINITLEELIDGLNETGIYKEKLSKTTLVESLKKLKKFKIIDMNIKNFETNNVILIYPTICHLVNINNIEMLNNRLKAYIAKDEEEEYETEED